jgi:chromosome segregation ATPase
MMDDIGERIKQEMSENKQLMDALTACHEKLDGLYLAQDVYLERIRNDKVEIERLREEVDAIKKERDEAKEYVAKLQLTFKGHVYIKNEEWAEVHRKIAKRDREIERLHAELQTFEHGYVAKLGEIGRLKAELDDAKLEQAWAERNAAVAELHNYKEVSQAREAKLREALEKIATNTIHWYASIQDAKAALALPADDTALQEAIRQAKQEVLLEAAEAVSHQNFRNGNPWASETIRRLAEELK